MRKIISPTKRKFLLLLAAGLALSLTRSPKTYWRIIGEIPVEFRNIDRQYLYRMIREFHSDRLVDFKELSGGMMKMILSDAGRKHVLSFDIHRIRLKQPKRWDRSWRIVLFDIPEKLRKGRDALRDKLKELGFRELQKSVFIYPHECRDEIDFVIEFFELRPYVRQATITRITNEAELKLQFGLV